MKNADKPISPIVNQEGCPTHQSFLESVNHQQHLNGLSKREYYAGLAMQGLLASGRRYTDRNFALIAEDSVKLADQLLKQLDK